MRALVRDERGEMGLVQLLVAMVIMVLVLGATLAVFDSAVRINVEANERNDSQDQARRTLDRLAKEMRNLASPKADQPQAIDLAGVSDLVFQTVDRVGPNSGANTSNVMRVRYCVGGTKLHRQEQRWTSATTPATPDVSSCPSAAPGWLVASNQVVAEHVVNGTGARPVFVYDEPVATDISSVHVQLFMDRDVVRPPGETTLSTGVFLRNQNRRPEAGFTADTSVPGKIVLNGGLSTDPEGEPLTYTWLDGGTEIPGGTGIRFDYTVARGTSHQITLEVTDPAGLPDTSPAQTVVAP